MATGRAAIEGAPLHKTVVMTEQLEGSPPEQHAELLNMLRLLADSSLDQEDRKVWARAGVGADSGAVL